MIVLAEAGATKIQWGILVDKKLIEFNTSGFNPNLADRNYLRQLLISGFPVDINPDQVSTVAYYGAGCGSEAGKNEVLRALSNFFVQAGNIKVYSDLEAIGRIVHAPNKGYVGVLGTGASFAFFDGEKTEMLKLSLGFLLGDEGSGAWLGKQLLSKIILSELPVDVEKAFYEQYTEYSCGHDLIKSIYSQKNQSAYCAQFVPFIKQWKDTDELKSLVQGGFSVYVERYVVPTISKRGESNIALVGSLAYHFSEILNQVFNQYSIKTPVIIQKPFYELVNKYQ